MPSHTIYYVRHGQCAGNVTGETLPPEQDVITEFGQKQADILGEYMKDVEFTKAYASTFSRAIDTAQGILSKSRKSCPVELIQDPRVCERDMGDMVGKSAKEIAIATLGQLQLGKKFNEIEVPGGESVVNFEERIRSFFKDLFEGMRSLEKPETVLVVSHGLTMRRFLVGLRDTFSDICTTENWDKRCQTVIENTACTEIALEYPSPSEKPLIRFVKIHDTEHLKALDKESRDAAQGDHAINDEMKQKLIEKVMQIPGAREEISGCIPV